MPQEIKLEEVQIIDEPVIPSWLIFPSDIINVKEIAFIHKNSYNSTISLTMKNKEVVEIYPDDLNVTWLAVQKAFTGNNKNNA